jgi:acyl-CoA reductase-like NAD-dependent aldehyde dehydrogenase/nicotinamidase-related amidase
MKPALLLVDIQNDFLERSGLTPSLSVLVEQAGYLLETCRRLGIPVIHVHTVVLRDGTNRMPHWKKNDVWACVEGTRGCMSPARLAPTNKEPVFHKSFFTAFSDSRLDTTLRRLNVDSLIVAGVYLHGCVRATVLDAYERGYTVWVAADAVASTEPVHAELTRTYLNGRAAVFLTSREIIDRLGRQDPEDHVLDVRTFPVACVDGDWIPAAIHTRWRHQNPAKWSEPLADIPLGREREVELAASAATKAQRNWKQRAVAARIELLYSWTEQLSRRERELIRLLALEIGKPVADGRAEVRRAITLLQTTARLCAKEQLWTISSSHHVYARHRPVGVIALVTPWNNPVAIPIGKLAPALVFGNAVLWKPALQAPDITRVLMETLMDAGLPSGLVNLVFGDSATVQAMVYEPNVAAVSLTGSSGTGRQVTAMCAQAGKPLQAELGGNNAVIVMSDCHIREAAQSLALSAFSFAGQRCTATRRFIVEESIRADFEEALVSAVSALHVGNPIDPSTQVGPLISREKQGNVKSIVASAVQKGARLLCGGYIPEEFQGGCWYQPTLLGSVSPLHQIVQEETFGPVAVIQNAINFDEALRLCNGVPQGLVAGLYSTNESIQKRFLEAVEAGVVKINRGAFDIHPEAPFCGWKDSGMGPPEHGIWDREFYSRPQAIYGME